MTTAYTSLLGLALPVTGELDGTWGDTVNDYITEYVDASVAGAQTISGSQTAVTLSITNGTSLSQAGSGSTGSSQYQIINCTGNPAGLLTITAPASSKSYIIVNATSTSQSVKIVGAGPTTGVTVVSGEKALVVWNGSDFVKVSTSTAGSGTVTSVGWTGGIVSVATATTTPAFTIAGTSGGIPYFSSGTTWATSAALAANALVVGGGAGTAPSTVTTGSGVLTALSNTANATGGVVTTDGTATLSNKRIDPRNVVTTSAASVTPDVSAGDIYAFTALAATLAINAPIGTPTDGDKLIFRFLDNGVAQTLNWNGTYTAIGVTLPTTTTAGKTTYVGCIYNANNTRWDVIAVTTQA